VQHAFKRAGVFHGGLVGLDVSDGLADGDFVPFLDGPFGEGSLGHGVAELGHFDEFGHGENFED
jgi:hypothetical protein